MTAPDPLLIEPVHPAGWTLLVRPGAGPGDDLPDDALRITIGDGDTLREQLDRDHLVGRGAAHTFTLDRGRAAALRQVLDFYIGDDDEDAPFERPADVDPLPADPVDPDDVDVVLLTADQDRRVSALHAAAGVVERLLREGAQAAHEHGVHLHDVEVVDEVLRVARYIEHGDGRESKAPGPGPYGGPLSRGGYIEPGGGLIPHP